MMLSGGSSRALSHLLLLFSCRSRHTNSALGPEVQPVCSSDLFHDCIYEGLWKDNARRHNDKTPTFDVINTFGPDYKTIFVGDAFMSPYEVTYKGGSVEQWNEEPATVWLTRMLDHWPSSIWLNPRPEQRWEQLGRASWRERGCKCV